MENPECRIIKILVPNCYQCFITWLVLGPPNLHLAFNGKSKQGEVVKKLSQSTSSNLDEVQPDEMGNSVLSINPHVSEASREVANLTLTPIISGTAKQNGLKKNWTSMAKTHVSKKRFVQKVAGRAGAEGQNSSISTQYDYLTFHVTRTKNQSKKVCRFGCQSCF